MSKSDNNLPYAPCLPQLSPDNSIPIDDLPYLPEISPNSYLPSTHSSSPPIQIVQEDQSKNDVDENYSDNEYAESSDSDEIEDSTENVVASIKNLQPPTPVSPVVSPIEPKSKNSYVNTESEYKPGTSSIKTETKQCVPILPTVQKSKEPQQIPVFMTDAELHTFTRNFELHLKAHVAYGKQLIIASKEYQDSIAAVKRAREKYINLVKVGSKFFGNYCKK